MKQEKALAFAAFVTVCIVWGTTYLGIAIAVETIPPFLLTAIRFLFAGVVMLSICVARGERLPRDSRTLANIAVIGILMIGAGNLAVVWAEQWMPSGMAALLVATAPFWMVIIERFRGDGERVDFRSGMGMLIGFLGVAMLVTPGGAGGKFGPEILLGALAIQVGSVCWQLGTVRGKYYVKNVPLMTSASLQMLAGGLFCGIIGLAIGETSRFSLNVRTFSAMAYLTIFGSIIAYSAYVYANAHIRTTKLSLYAYVNPAIAVFAGWLVLDEKLTWVSVTAMAVILGGVALVQTAGMRKKVVAAPAPQPVPHKTAA